MATKKIFKLLTGHYKSSANLNTNKSASTNNLNDEINKQQEQKEELTTSSFNNKNQSSSCNSGSRLKPIRDFFKQKFTKHYKSTSELNKKSKFSKNDDNKEPSNAPINIAKPNLREKILASKNKQILDSSQTFSEDEGLSKTPQHLISLNDDTVLKLNNSDYHASCESFTTLDSIESSEIDTKMLNVESKKPDTSLYKSKISAASHRNRRKYNKQSLLNNDNKQTQQEAPLNILSNLIEADENDDSLKIINSITNEMKSNDDNVKIITNTNDDELIINQSFSENDDNQEENKKL